MRSVTMLYLGTKYPVFDPERLDNPWNLAEDPPESATESGLKQPRQKGHPMYTDGYFDYTDDQIDQVIDAILERDDDPDFGDPLDWPSWCDEHIWNITNDIDPDDLGRWETGNALEFELPLVRIESSRSTLFDRWILDRRNPE